jgi:hypothetical protein
MWQCTREVWWLANAAVIGTAMVRPVGRLPKPTPDDLRIGKLARSFVKWNCYNRRIMEADLPVRVG